MAVKCRACASGDHADCTRWLMRDHPCRCVCDEAPRQLHFAFETTTARPAPAGAQRRPAPAAGGKECPW